MDRRYLRKGANSMDRRKRIAEILIKLRNDHNMTQVQMAKRVGIAQSTYGMYESGDRIPNDENKIKIANIYGMTVQEIFFNK